MADVAAKREARRRKILENSAYRLKRITGQANHNQESVERIKNTGECAVPSNSSNSTANNVLASAAIIESQSVDSLISELNADIDVEESTSQLHYADFCKLLSTPNVPHRRNVGQANASGESGNVSRLIKLNNSNNDHFSPERRNSLGDLLMDNANEDNQNIIESFTNYLLSSRSIYVALAVVVNLMITLKLEHLFGMSIIVPFFVIMIGRLCACKNDEVSQGSNMLVAALILSNVRPELVKIIHKLKSSFSYSGKILKDFAVYMFTFVLIHTALHWYWNDLDYTSTFPHEPQEIFDSNDSK